jgi:redox-regulated HSP33 family molecular chaperone
MFFLSYVMLGVTFALIEISRATGFDSQLMPPVKDKTQEVFEDWFRDAAVITVPKSKHVVDEEVRT